MQRPQPRKSPPPLPPPPGARLRYLRPEDTRALRDLEFHPRRMHHGHFAGRHASPQRGQSSEFSDYREYTPGDEIRHLDWKVLGRTDRLYIKTFEHQAQMDVHLLIDASASMAYGRQPSPGLRTPGISPGPSRDRGKYDFACRLAAAIAYLVIRQQDRAGLAFASGGLRPFMPPRGTVAHLFELVTQMERIQPRGASQLDIRLSELVRRLRRRAVILIFSDFMDDEPAILRELRAARHRGHTVGLFHVLHPHELALPDVGEVLLTDSENPEQTLRFHAPDLRADYAAQLDAFLRRWHESALALGIDHQIAPSDRYVPDLLRAFLTSHARSH